MTEYIELSVTINDTTYPVRCELPSTLKASSGPMSVRAAMEPSVQRLVDRLAEMLDGWMEQPRIARVDHDLKPSA